MRDAVIVTGATSSRRGAESGRLHLRGRRAGLGSSIDLETMQALVLAGGEGTRLGH